MAEESEVITKKEPELRYSELLKNAGLSEKEAAVFEVLLERGEQGAGEIIEKTGLKRGDAYNHIYSLKQKGFLEERMISGRLKFSLSHPNKIADYLDRRFQEAEQVRKELSSVLPNLISTYNLSYHQPGVKVFEGKERVEKMMRDSLTSQTEILSIVDPEAVDKIISLENRRYVKSRERLGIKKRIIVPDSPYNRKRYQKWPSGVTEVRFCKGLNAGFATSLQVYDDKLSFQTLKESAMVGIIIQSPLIGRLQRNVFEALWEHARPL